MRNIVQRRAFGAGLSPLPSFKQPRNFPECGKSTATATNKQANPQGAATGAADDDLKGSLLKVVSDAFSAAGVNFELFATGPFEGQSVLWEQPVDFRFSARRRYVVLA